MVNNKFLVRCILIIASALIAAESTIAQSKPSLLVDRLAAHSIIKGLPLENHQTIKSGDGRTKQWWRIAGIPYASFEIIGDIQSDADLVGWQCAEFDSAGNYASPVRDESFCRKFFIQVLGNILKKPEAVANDLLIKAKKIQPQTAIREFSDFSIETNGRFYFIRRLSRMN